ncbi:MAG TPA: thioredoxin domain-containing protein, partial [Candidatus Angelobacter sp.]|nr:thioredoxin domain-containing protein [Candidatus Angelobacter sp.]
YGIAAVHLSRPHTQVVVVGNDEAAQDLYRSAVAPFALNKAVMKFSTQENVVPQNLAPALAQTIPRLPTISEKRSAAIICSGFSCQPPIADPKELTESLSRITRRF